jgi:hypothetical protein
MTSTRSPYSDLRVIANRLQRREPRDRDGRRLLEVQVHRLRGEAVAAATGVLGKRAVAGAEDLIADP